MLPKRLPKTNRTFKRDEEWMHSGALVEPSRLADQSIVSLGLLLTFSGFTLALIVISVPAARSRMIRGRGGAVVIVAPFPLIIGSGPTHRQTSPPAGYGICRRSASAPYCPESIGSVCQFETLRILLVSGEKLCLDSPDSGRLSRHSATLLLVAVLLIFSGFALLIFGLSGIGSTGGCVLWPLPLIVACGFGSGSGLAPALILVSFGGLAFLLFLLETIRSRETL